MTQRYRADFKEWQALRLQVFRRDGGICQLCQRPVAPEDYEPDHIIPRSKFGSDTLENLRTTHKSCNHSRGNGETKSPILDGQRRGYPPTALERLSSSLQRVLRDLHTEQALIDSTLGWYVGVRWTGDGETPADYRLHVATFRALQAHGSIMETHAGIWVLAPAGYALFAA